MTWYAKEQLSCSVQGPARTLAIQLRQGSLSISKRPFTEQPRRSSRLLPDHDPEIGRALKGYLEEEGIGVVMGTQVERIEREGNERVVRTCVHGRTQLYRAEQVLMALDRQANTAGMGLEEMGVELDENGAIMVSGQMRTSHPDIYATGDCIPNPNFVYVAAGGAIAAENALTGAGRVLDLSAMPGVVFTDPQVATAGLTEAQAKAKGLSVEIAKLPLRYVPRAQAARDARGFIKLVADGATGRLLGAHILAAEGGEVVQFATLAIKFDLTLDDLTGTLFPYLTQVEGLKLAALTFSKDVTKLSCCAA